MSEEMYKSMFQDTIRALAAIDTALGMPEDGCNSPERTITAIKLLHAAHRDDVAEIDRLRGLLIRCLPIIEADARMMADITRHSPLDPVSQAQHDSTEYESERLVSEIPAALASAADQPSSALGQGVESSTRDTSVSRRASIEAAARSEAVLNAGGRTGQGAPVQPSAAPKNRCTICGGTDVSPLTFDVWECDKCGDFVPEWARAADNGTAGPT